jgi:hypothetical protein
MPSHRTSLWCILILSSHPLLVLSSCLFPSGFPSKIHTHSSSPPCVLHALSVSYFLALSFWLHTYIPHGVRLSPLGTAATVWPVVPTPDDCGAVGGMRIGRGSRILGETLPQWYFVHHKSHVTSPGLEPGPPLWEAAH